VLTLPGSGERAIGERDHLKLYGALPPVAVTVKFVQSPGQSRAFAGVIEQLGDGKLVKLPVHVVLQVFASTTVAVYAPRVLTLKQN